MGPAGVAVDEEGVEVPVPQWAEFLGDGSGSGWYSAGGAGAGGAEGGGGDSYDDEDSVARHYGFGFAALETGAAVAGGSDGAFGAQPPPCSGATATAPPSRGPRAPAPARRAWRTPRPCCGTWALSRTGSRTRWRTWPWRPEPRARTARWQGDGALAVDTQGALALAGREAQAVALQHSLRDAVRALGISASDGSLGSEEAAALREVLFSLVGDVRRQVSARGGGGALRPRSTALADPHAPLRRPSLRCPPCSTGRASARPSWLGSRRLPPAAGGARAARQQLLPPGGPSDPLQRAEEARRMAQRAQTSALRMQQVIDAAAQVRCEERVPGVRSLGRRTSPPPPASFLHLQLPPEQAKAALLAAGLTPLQAHNALAAAAQPRARGGAAAVSAAPGGAPPRPAFALLTSSTVFACRQWER